MFDALNHQRDRLVSYTEKNGIEVTAVYSDAGYSGRTLDCPGLKAVMRAVREGRGDTVLVLRGLRTHPSYLPLRALG